MDARVELYNWSQSKVLSLLSEIDEISVGIPEVEETKLLKEDSQKEEWFIKLKISGGKLENSYVIKLRISPDYPKSLPYCFELSDNFPKIGDEAIERHIVQSADYTEYPIEGSFCMISSFRIPYVFGKNKTDAYNTINLLLINHLWNQEFYTKNGYFIGDKEEGYKHGPEGLEESLKDMYPELVGKYLVRFLISGVMREISLNKKCFCGSGKLSKYCHQDETMYGLSIDFTDDHIVNMLKFYLAREIYLLTDAKLNLVKRFKKTMDN